MTTHAANVLPDAVAHSSAVPIAPPHNFGNSGAKTYTLLGPDGTPYRSTQPGTLGGHRRSRIFGRLDCPSALRWIARGHYVAQRVFFADEATALAAGYRPCAVCFPEQYCAWRQARISG